MEENTSLNPKLFVGKETIRKNIRNGLAYKSSSSFSVSDVSGELFPPCSNLFVQFVETFRAAGGKYIPCTTQNMVQYLVKIAQGQQYNILLNTSPNLGAYLDKYKVRHVNAVGLNEPVDAALFFSDVLVASSGAIGFSQPVSQYASVKNLAKDIIVVSRERCIFPDYESALAYQSKRNGTPYPMTEFVVPTRPEEEEEGKPLFTPLTPRIILMLIEEPRTVTTNTETTPSETTPETPTANESQV